jgi:6-phosphogluconolactonase/glucosamine-6-phosphate isomerase/deaminase
MAVNTHERTRSVSLSQWLPAMQTETTTITTATRLSSVSNYCAGKIIVNLYAHVWKLSKNISISNSDVIFDDHWCCRLKQQTSSEHLVILNNFRKLQIRDVQIFRLRTHQGEFLFNLATPKLSVCTLCYTQSIPYR